MKQPGNSPLNVFYTWFSNTLRHPKYRWWIIIGSLVYLFSPLDIAPDFIPIIGQLDDITIVGLLIAELSQVAAEYLQKRKGQTVKGDEMGAPTTIEVDAVSVGETATSQP
jgi:uncharacterized membrane protein YkvA (DUF1232 family)